MGGPGDDLLRLRSELEVPDGFPAAVEAEAAAAAARGVPGGPVLGGFATLDPPGSRDLDQAFAVERRPGGWRVRYAIADVAAWVAPGGAVDAEARRRGATLYLPDGRAPLHPPALSEGAASLLPGQVAPALVWDLEVDDDGADRLVGLGRAAVRSEAQLDYPSAQARLEAGTAEEPLVLLREVGAALLGAAARRGAVDLPTPAQEASLVGGRWHLELRAPLPVERWNAQLSLATGRAAGSLQAGHGWGVLRTLPTAEPEDVEEARRTALALGVAWPAGTSWAAVVRALDPAQPRHAALLAAVGRLLRGASHEALVGGTPLADPPGHAGVGAAYAHATAPLRRLGDRFVGECCLAAVAGDPPPAWVQEALPDLPALLDAAAGRGASVERAVLDLVEARLLEAHVGAAFDAVAVTDRQVQLVDPPVRARCDGDLPVGSPCQVRLVEADPARRAVRFQLVDRPPPQ